VRRDHHGSTGAQRSLDGRHGSADAGVFGDVAGVVLRHVEVGADKHALAGKFAFGDEIGQTQDVRHGSNSRNRGKRRFYLITLAPSP